MPEAQLDRFLFNIKLDYPSFENELEIVKTTTSDDTVELRHILNAEQIIEFQHLVRKAPVTDHVVEYAVGLVHQLRPGTAKASKMANEYLEWGAGPRGSQTLILGAKCHALLNGKYSPDIEDVKAIAIPTLRHRIIRNFKAEAEHHSLYEIIIAHL